MTTKGRSGRFRLLFTKSIFFTDREYNWYKESHFSRTHVAIGDSHNTLRNRFVHHHHQIVSRTKCVKILPFIVIYWHIISCDEDTDICTAMTKCSCAHPSIILFIPRPSFQNFDRHQITLSRVSIRNSLYIIRVTSWSYLCSATNVHVSQQLRINLLITLGLTLL